MSVTKIIVQISDLHFGRVDPPVAEALVEDIHQQSPTIVVISGDLTQRAREDQYLAAAAYLQRLPDPRLVVPGNHDISLYNVFRRFFQTHERFQRIITSDLSPVWRDDGLLVIGVNSARPLSFRPAGFWKDGCISDAQLREVQRIAGETPESVCKVVVTHHPFIPPPGKGMHDMIHRGPRALAAMEQCGVDLVLAGHLHQGYSGDVRTHYEAVTRSILSVQAGTATSTRRRHEPNAYNVIQIDHPMRIGITVRQWDGARFVTGAVTEFVKTNSNWERAGAASANDEIRMTNDE
jgi:3',5'-cyclic AMP phosphodiesterase CpdA